MHIGFDISQTGAMKAGCGYFAHALAAAMLASAPENVYSLYPSFGDFFFDVNMPEANPFPGANVRYGPRHRSLEEARAFWNSPALEAALGRPDVVHSNNFWCPRGLASTRLVYTLHDLSFVTNPSWTTEINRAACWQGASRSAGEADWILAVSEASRRHYLEVFPDFPEERVRVIYPCSRFAEWHGPGSKPAALGAVGSGGFWLSVGTIEPRKNQKAIANAYARYLQRGGPPLPLVFTGGHGWLMEDFQHYLDELGVRANVIITGYVSDEELAWLYQNCRAHLYVSHFEGFGLPVLEGMHFGAPTIASDTTSLPEVAGAAAILLRPDDGEGLTNALLRLAGDAPERARLQRDGRAQAARFDWRASAAALLALYQEAVATPKARRALRAR